MSTGERQLQGRTTHEGTVLFDTAALYTGVDVVESFDPQDVIATLALYDEGPREAVLIRDNTSGKTCELGVAMPSGRGSIVPSWVSRDGRILLRKSV